MTAIALKREWPEAVMPTTTFLRVSPRPRRDGSGRPPARSDTNRATSGVPAARSDEVNCLARVRSGDQEAAPALVERLYPTVLRSVRCHLPRRTSEEDLTQAVF